MRECMGTHTFEDGYSFRALWTRDKVPAYISWEHWEQNQRKLRENSTKFGFGVSRGSTLLAGRVVCGKCGARMSVHYRDGIPSFDCTKASMQFGEPVCQTFNGRWLEPLVAELVLKAMEPTAVEMSLIAAEDIEQDRARLEKLHQQTVERAKYQADLARRRYEEVLDDSEELTLEVGTKYNCHFGGSYSRPHPSTGGRIFKSCGPESCVRAAI